MAIHEVAIRVVLNQEVVRRVPVVEDLGAENVSADTPGGVVAFGHEPLGVSTDLVQLGGVVLTS